MRLFLFPLVVAIALQVTAAIAVAADVEGILNDESGKPYLMVEGLKWSVIQADGGTVMYVNDLHKQISYSDPRLRAVKSPQDVRGVKVHQEGHHYIETSDKEAYNIYADKESGRIYFYNVKTKHVQWHDPRYPEPGTRTSHAHCMHVCSWLALC